MYKYVIKRILLIIPVLIGVAFLVFTLMYFTHGDPATIMMSGATAEEIDALRTKLGLNDPYWVQLLHFFRDTFLKFDLGNSYINSKSVASEIMERLPRTAFLAAFCAVLQVVLGIPLGMTAAMHQNKWQDNVCMIVAMLGVSIPNFWFALLLILLFSLQLGWLPSHGIGGAQYWILPIIAAGLPTIGSVARMTRSQMLEVIHSDYIVTARAKGVPERDILYRHALPNSLIPVITSIGTSFGRALGGTVVIESVFSIPGVGMYMVDAIGKRDYPVIRGSILVMAILFSLVMLAVDLIYAFIDPRIKAQYEGQQKKRIRKGGLQNG